MGSYQFFLNICGYAFIFEIFIVIIVSVLQKWVSYQMNKENKNRLKQLVEFESILRETKERMAAEGKTPEEIERETIPGTPTMEEITNKYRHLFEDQLKPKKKKEKK